MYKPKRGFTIVEYATAMTLMSIILLGGMAFYFYSNRHIQTAFHRRIATEIANSKMEEIRKGGYGSLPEPAPSSGLWQGPLTINVRDLTAVENIYVYDTSNKLKQVAVEVVWFDPGLTSQQSIVLDTYIAK